MLKKIFITLFIFLCFNSSVFSKEIPVKIIPDTEISTSKGSLQEGDNIKLVIAEDVYVDSKLIIKKGEPVNGVITKLTENDFTCQPASIYAENFKVKNVDGKIVKLNGIVYKEGRNHSYITQYLENGFQLIRGGEVKINPQKDFFTLYLDDNKKREVKDDL